MCSSEVASFLFLFFALCLFHFEAEASFTSNFTSKVPCHDSTQICTAQGGTRNMDGFDVYKPCWEYSYSKSCNYPSLNNCQNHTHCYFIADHPCILKDSYGNCVNLKREVACSRKESVTLDIANAQEGFRSKRGDPTLVCKGIPCIDGNCVDKSFLTNGEMMDSISKLHAFSKMIPQGDKSFNLFAGHSDHCSKKIAEYTNCCSVSQKGWGGSLGAKCTPNERLLMKKRAKNLCVYVGQTVNKKANVTTVKKNYFCCFSNMLEKVVQLEGRKQLGLNFGYDGNPDCRGLTLEEIQRLDFSRIDFSEFINDLLVTFSGKYNSLNSEDLTGRINDSMSNIRTSKDTNSNDASSPNANTYGLKESYAREAEGSR